MRFSCLLVCSLIPACGAAPTAKIEAIPALVLTSADLYTAARDATAATDPAVLRGLGTAAYFARLTAAVTDEPLRFRDLGFELGDLHSRMVAKAPLFQALSAAYPTLGDLMKAGLAARPDVSSVAAFTANLRQAIGVPEASLALAALPPYVQPDGTYVTQDQTTGDQIATVVTNESPDAPAGSARSVQRSFYRNDQYLFSCNTAQFDAYPSSNRIKNGEDAFKVTLNQDQPYGHAAGVYVWNKAGVAEGQQVSAETLHEIVLNAAINWLNLNYMSACNMHIPAQGQAQPAQVTPGSASS